MSFAHDGVLSGTDRFSLSLLQHLLQIYSVGSVLYLNFHLGNGFRYIIGHSDQFLYASHQGSIISVVFIRYAFRVPNTNPARLAGSGSVYWVRDTVNVGKRVVALAATWMPENAG
jgi:hypothetical protein